MQMASINMSIQPDAELKAQAEQVLLQSDTCGQLGVTPAVSISKEQMLADTDQILADFASDYERMAQ